jgi:ElaB/YqjD/DUF883 family membrane-anchored ribosome-binding protein
MNTPESNTDSRNEKIAAGLTGLVIKLFTDLTLISEKILNTAHRADNDLLNLTLTFNNLDVLVKNLEKIDFPGSSILIIKKKVNEIKEQINEIYSGFHEQLQQATFIGPAGNVLATIASSNANLKANPLNHPWITSIQEDKKAELANEMQKLNGKIEAVILPAAKDCKQISQEITTEQIMLLSTFQQIAHEFKNTLKEHYMNPNEKGTIQSEIDSIHHDLTQILESLRKLLKTLPDEFLAINNRINAFSHTMLDILNPTPPSQKTSNIHLQGKTSAQDDPPVGTWSQ